MRYYTVNKTHSVSSDLLKPRPAPTSTQPRPSRGLGDTVQKLIHAIVPSSLLPKKPCGCGKRQAWLNKAVPYI